MEVEQKLFCGWVIDQNVFCRKMIRGLTTGGIVLLMLFGCGGGGGSNHNNKPPAPPPVETATVKIKSTGSFTDIDGNKQGTWVGSGFFIDETGYIVTNNHVVTGAGKLEVEVKDLGTLIATPIAYAECADLAVIKVDSNDYPALQWFQGEIKPGISIGVAGFSGNIRNNSGDGRYSYFEGTINSGIQVENSNWASVEACF